MSSPICQRTSDRDDVGECKKGRRYFKRKSVSLARLLFFLTPLYAAFTFNSKQKVLKQQTRQKARPVSVTFEQKQTDNIDTLQSIAVVSVSQL